MENTYVGPFLIVKKLGRNRRQKVYHARQTEQGRDVALKFISVPPTIRWDKALDKIQREVNELQKLRHENLVRVFGAGVDEDRIFFATELVDGESLTSILSRRGKLTPDLVVEYGRQISEVLRYLHAQDLIHSKLTPKKILVTPDHQIKITDLRLNRSKRRRWDETSRQRELDIAAYMAPEQFTEGATQKSDFYALGVILYEMLTGKLPYEPDTMGRMTKMKMNSPVPSVATHTMNCPIWLDKIVSQMLSPNPRNRPHSARAISMAFEEIKKIDASKKAAVSQMTSGFNPLTAGQDKTEARRLLGMKKKKKGKNSDVPFFKRIPFQIAALVSIIGLTMFLVIQSWTPHQQLIDDAKVMIASDDSSLWTKARIKLDRVMETEGELADEAEELYYQSCRKSLVYHAENGKNNRLQNENVQSFGKAVRHQQDGELDEAIEIFAELMATISPEGNERHIHFECKSRLEALAEKEVLPIDVGSLGDLIANTKNASTTGELMQAHDLLAKIMHEFAGEDGYKEVVELAASQLQVVKQKIAESDKPSEEESQDSAPDEEPEN